MSPVLSRAQLDEIIDFAKGKHSSQDFDHTFWHIELTVRIAEYLAERERANKEVCVIAAYLHDIAKNNSERHSLVEGFFKLYQSAISVDFEELARDI